MIAYLLLIDSKCKLFSIVSVAHVNCAKKTLNNSRIYDRRHACFYCGELCTKIARHLTTKHKSEEEVVKALSFRKNSSERKKQLAKLRLRGDYHHNMTTLETGEGELIVVRRPGQDMKCSVNNFLACEYCLGFIKHDELWKHQNACEFKPKSNESKKTARVQVQKQAKLMTISTITGSDNDKLNKIIAAMRMDEISAIVRTDELIKKFGAMYVERNGAKDAHFISQKIRELARLVQGLQEVDENPTAKLSDYIKPDKFDKVVEAVKKTSGFPTTNEEVGVLTPSLALKLGYSLQKCALIIRGEALRDKDNALLEDVENFKKLMESEWEFRISHHSLATLSERKYNKVNVLPLAEDIDKLRRYIDEKVTKTSSDLKKDPKSSERWAFLAKLLLARLVMLNKRRGGEASKLTLKSYNSRPDWTQACNAEIMASLSMFEQELCKR